MIRMGYGRIRPDPKRPEYTSSQVSVVGYVSLAILEITSNVQIRLIILF